VAYWKTTAWPFAENAGRLDVPTSCLPDASMFSRTIWPLATRKMSWPFGLVLLPTRSVCRDSKTADLPFPDSAVFVEFFVVGTSISASGAA
jgi:hypothetical protein